MADTSTLTNIVGSSGLIGIAVSTATFLATWLRDHDAAQRHKTDVESAEKAVAFWKTWFEARQLLSSPNLDEDKRLVLAELQRLSDSAVQRRLERERTTGTTPFSLRKAFLLYVPPKHSLGIWVLRIYFYFSLLAIPVTPINIWQVSSRTLQPASHTKMVAQVVVMTAFAIVWVVILRSIILYLERRSLKSTSH